MPCFQKLCLEIAEADNRKKDKMVYWLAMHAATDDHVIICPPGNDLRNKCPEWNGPRIPRRPTAKCLVCWREDAERAVAGE